MPWPRPFQHEALLAQGGGCAHVHPAAHRPSHRRMRNTTLPPARLPGNGRVLAHAQCKVPPRAATHHVPGAHDDGTGADVAAAAAAGAVEAVPAPLERHDCNYTPSSSNRTRRLRLLR